MDLLVLDENFELVDLADDFESKIWTDRYCGYGDFEIYTLVSPKVLSSIRAGRYIWTLASEHVMVVEGLEIISDIDTGAHIKITGRSLESILDRRIVWESTVLTGSFQDGIQQLLNENAISPINEDRKISRLIFEPSDDPVILAMTIDAQFHGETLYEAITNLCLWKNLGYKITLTNEGMFIFKLYAGADRSYEQETNPYVIFSTSFENLSNTNYLSTDATRKTSVLVAGDYEGDTRKTLEVGGGSDLERREVFTEAGGLPPATGEAYTALLQQKGLESLAENSFVETFDGQVETTHIFKYGEDFFLGDIIQIVNEYGIESRARVTEFIHSHSLNGSESYPTFVTVNGKVVPVGRQSTQNVSSVPIPPPSPSAPKFAATIGNGSMTSIAVTHNLGTRNVMVAVYETANPYREVMCDIERTDVNTITIKTSTPPATNQYTVVIG